MFKYTEDDIIMSKNDWLAWFSKYGNHEDWSDASDWFADMLRAKLLVEV